MTDQFSYPDCRPLFGDRGRITEAFRDFNSQEIDEVDITDAATVYPAFRTTLAGTASVSGVGTFRGKEKRTLTFGPSSRPGWWIRRTDHPEQLDTEVDISNLWTSARNLVLRSGSTHNYLRMVEHIIALKNGLGLDDAVISTNSGDPPLFARSSLPLIETVEQAGIVETKTPASFFTVKEPLAFGGSRGDFLLFLPPRDKRPILRLDVAINFPTIIQRQRIVFDVTPATFRHGAFARTNATHRQYQLAKTVGLLFADTRNLGYDKTNILIHGRKYYCEPRLEQPGTGKALEPVWHRATLDLLAAIALMGPGRFVGTVVSYRAGHTLDCDAVRAIRRMELLTPFV